MSDTETEPPNAFEPVSFATWQERVERDLKGRPFATLRTPVTPTGELLAEPLYTKDDDLGANHSGFPGLAPFVRGVAPEGFGPEGWAVCQEYDDPRMEVAGAAIAADLSRGTTAVWLRAGCDHGVRVLTAGDLDVVLRDVDLAKVPVQLDGGIDAMPLAAAFVALATHREVDLADLRGGFGADPVGTLLTDGGLPYGLGRALGCARDLSHWCCANAPRLRAVLVDTRAYHDAGADPVQELAWAMATGALYMRELIASGLSASEAAGQVRFAFPVSGEFFPQIAKLRAARWLWSKVVSAFGGDTQAQAMAMHARTSSFTKTVRDPWVNMLRATAETAAAAIGGAESIATGTFDEAVGAADPFSRRVARNTQIVLRDESYLHRVSDPAGGSWYIEQLTDKLARAAWTHFQEVESAGGIIKSISHGLVRRSLSQTRAAREQALGKRTTSIVGVNEFASLTEERLTRDTVDMDAVEGELGNPLGAGTPEERQQRLGRVHRMIHVASEAQGELTARVVDAVESGVDLFSLGQVLRDGAPSLHVEPLEPWRASQSWEALRDGAELAAGRGHRIEAFLCNLGPIPAHKARSMWTVNLLAAAGIATSENDGFETAEAALAAYREAGAPPMVVFVGKDEVYDAAMSQVLAFKEAGARVVAVAGKVRDKQEAYAAAGVDQFLFAGCDAMDVLRSVHRELGVSA